MQDKIDFCKQYLNDKDITVDDLYDYLSDDKAKKVITELTDKGYNIEIIGKALFDDKPDYIHIVRVLDKRKPLCTSVVDFYGFLPLKQRVRGCIKNIKLITTNSCTENENMYFEYLIENEENRCHYIVTVGYKEPSDAERLGDIQSLMVEAKLNDGPRNWYAPIIDGILNVKTLMCIVIESPDIYPIVTHMIMNEGSKNAELLRNTVSDVLYKNVFDIFPGSPRELDYLRDVESHIKGTCNCIKQ